MSMRLTAEGIELEDIFFDPQTRLIMDPSHISKKTITIKNRDSVNVIVRAGGCYSHRVEVKPEAAYVFVGGEATFTVHSEGFAPSSREPNVSLLFTIWAIEETYFDVVGVARSSLMLNMLCPGQAHHRILPIHFIGLDKLNWYHNKNKNGTPNMRCLYGIQIDPNTYDFTRPARVNPEDVE